MPVIHAHRHGKTPHSLKHRIAMMIFVKNGITVIDFYSSPLMRRRLLTELLYVHCLDWICLFRTAANSVR
jgi:hypothetical protein